MHQINVLYTLNSHHVICHIHKKKNQREPESAVRVTVAAAPSVPRGERTMAPVALRPARLTLRQEPSLNRDGCRQVRALTVTLNLSHKTYTTVYICICEHVCVCTCVCVWFHN